jgi:hypothetical protein
MFGPITIPFGAKMLFNTVKLKPGVSFDQLELAVGEMCMVVKKTYGGEKGGFIAGQVFRFSGFVSEEGSLNPAHTADAHYGIVTYWKSFEDHERSHADEVFHKTFAAVAEMCSDTMELGYELLWQGEANSS